MTYVSKKKINSISLFSGSRSKLLREKGSEASSRVRVCLGRNIYIRMDLYLKRVIRSTLRESYFLDTFFMKTEK